MPAPTMATRDGSRFAPAPQPGRKASAPATAPEASTSRRLRSRMRRSCHDQRPLRPVRSRAGARDLIAMPRELSKHLEDQHRAKQGNALRAAVLGANDGLVSNLSLVM